MSDEEAPEPPSDEEPTQLSSGDPSASPNVPSAVSLTKWQLPLWTRNGITLSQWRLSFAETMKRRVSVPLWAVLTSALLMLFLLSSCLGLAAANGANRSTPNSGKVAVVPTATIAPPPTLGPTATPLPPQPTATNAPPPTWHTVQTFSGNGHQNAESFYEDAINWRIAWSCNPASTFGGQYNLIVSVYLSDGSDADIGAINTICQPGNTSGNTTEDLMGNMYLDIESEGAWTVKVQENY